MAENNGFFEKSAISKSESKDIIQALTVIRSDQFSKTVNFLNKTQFLCVLHDELVSNRNHLTDYTRLNYLETVVAGDTSLATLTEQTNTLALTRKQAGQSNPITLVFKEIFQAFMTAASTRDIANEKKLESAITPLQNLYASRRHRLSHGIQQNIEGNKYIDWVVNSTETFSAKGNEFSVNFAETNDGYDPNDDFNGKAFDLDCSAFPNEAAYSAYNAQRHLPLTRPG